MVSALRSTHIQTGRPTRPLAEPGGGAVLISGALRAMEEMACCARTTGSAAGSEGEPVPFARKMSPDHTPGPQPAGRGHVNAQIMPSSGRCPAHTGCPIHGWGFATARVQASGGDGFPPPSCPALALTPPGLPLTSGVDTHSEQVPVRGSVLEHSTPGSAAAIPEDVRPSHPGTAASTTKLKMRFSMAGPAAAPAWSPTRVHGAPPGTGRR